MMHGTRSLKKKKMKRLVVPASKLLFHITYFITNHKTKISRLLSHVITSRHYSKLSLILLLPKGGPEEGDYPS